MNQSTIVNNITLILLLSLFLFTPFEGFKKIVVLVVLMIMWFFTSYVYNRKALRQSLILVLILCSLLFVQWVYSLSVGEEQFRRFFTQNIWTYIWGVLGVYYASNINVFKKCIPFIVVMITVSCIYTIVGNYTIPGASRMLAGYVTEGTETYSQIKSMNIGGYGFIYALLFAVIPCVLWIKQCRSTRFLSILFLIIVMTTLLVGSYFTSILLAIVALVFSFSNASSITKFAIVFSILALLVVIFRDAILMGLIDFGEFIDSPMLQIRAQEMLDGTYQELHDSAGTYSRWDRINNAIQNIGDSPFWGRMSSRNLDVRPSGHSELLGYFERFGILGLLHILYFYLVFKSIIRKAYTQEMKLQLRLFFLLFFVFITLDTFDVANSTGCMVFFVAPCTMLYIESRDNRFEVQNNAQPTHA